MYQIEGTTIRLTRGDSLAIQLQLMQGDEEYTPQEGDSIKFGLKSKLNAARTAFVENTPLVEKAISTSDMMLRLDPEDTKSLPFGNYSYDVEVTLSDGKVDTVISNAYFILKPEVI